MNPLALLHASTPIVLQGISGRQGRVQVMRLLQSGTRVVAGVAPGHGGETIEGVPVFDGMKQAVDETGARVAMIMVPPRAAPEAVIEAISARMRLIVLVTEHIAAQTALDLVEEARANGSCLIGPNTAGLILPGRVKIGIMAHEMYMSGAMALLSRSGTLMSEVAHQLKNAGVGQSVCIDIGGDPIVGHGFAEVLGWLRSDGKTKAAAILGEIGGRQEHEACQHLRDAGLPFPIYGLVVGHAAPDGRRMGHAGALIEGEASTARSKTAAFEQLGIRTAATVDQLVRRIRRDLAEAEVAA